MEGNIINIGEVNISSLAKELINKKDIEIATNRIIHRDFGNLCDMECEIQLIDVNYNDRKSMKLFGIYKSSNNHEFYVIVSEDRKNTNVLLCDEYEN